MWDVPVQPAGVGAVVAVLPAEIGLLIVPDRDPIIPGTSTASGAVREDSTSSMVSGVGVTPARGVISGPAAAVTF